MNMYNIYIYVHYIYSNNYGISLEFFGSHALIWDINVRNLSNFGASPHLHKATATGEFDLHARGKETLHLPQTFLGS